MMPLATENVEVKDAATIKRLELSALMSTHTLALLTEATERNPFAARVLDLAQEFASIPIFMNAELEPRSNKKVLEEALQSKQVLEEVLPSKLVLHQP